MLLGCRRDPVKKVNPLVWCAKPGKLASSYITLAALSLSINVLTVTVCLSKASAYLTGGNVNIFMLCTLIGFLVKYSMVFLREKIFFSLAR